MLLLAPAQSFRLYPFPIHHPMDNFSMADPEVDDAFSSSGSSNSSNSSNGSEEKSQGQEDGESKHGDRSSREGLRFPAVGAAHGLEAVLEAGEVRVSD